ncbi:hypothetical protein [Yinghuangia sp. YIM S09857]|uniref:hypothetical protein n=1 Tax=Yinghuangia sp. YIM S09857 TaxID=3436929 RepID=UPI003F52FC7C
MATSLPPDGPHPGHTRGIHGLQGSDSDDGEQIFVDTSGRRKRWTRRAVLLLCLPLAAYLGLLATGIVSSSPLGTPPWVADQPQKPEGDKPADSGADTSPKPSATGKPGASSKTPRPTGGAPAARTPAGGAAASPAGTTGSTSPGNPQTPGATPTGSPDAGATSTKPGNAPVEPPGQTRRPTSANTNKGGH